jgi:hypothetical protein
MALQYLVKPGRAAPQGTDSQKGWQTPVDKIALPRQTFLPFSVRQRGVQVTMPVSAGHLLSANVTRTAVSVDRNKPTFSSARSGQHRPLGQHRLIIPFGWSQQQVWLTSEPEVQPLKIIS